MRHGAAMPANGYWNRLLTADLTAGEFGEMPIRDADLRRYLGGSALAASLLYPHLTSSLDPLSPEAPLLFIGGPLTGTAGPSVGRYTVCARSPATGLWGESNCGGLFGPEMRLAGYDGILVTGRAPRPVYLWLRDGVAELRDAAHLWGTADTYATQSRVKSEVGESLARVACIGAAGEAQIQFAVILCDHGRVAGRTGMGAVMGSKNLKAVAVRGSRRPSLAREADFKSLRHQANVDLRQDALTAAFRDGGSANGADYLDYLGVMPKRYYTRSTFATVDKVSGATMHDTILTGVTTCHACVIACGRKVTIREGLYARPEGKGPEYETIVGFGPNRLIDDLGAVTHLGQLCDAYGLDTISTSNIVGLAYLMFAEGLLTKRDTGLDLKWGDPAGAEALIHQVARRHGLGAVAAQGARALARHFGRDDLAVQVNGLEVAYHDPRRSNGMALSYATSPRGACHNQSDYFMVNLGQSCDEIGIPMTEWQDEHGKAASVARHQDWRTVGNALVFCQFANVPPSALLNLVNAATGFDYNLSQLMTVGERAWNLKRAINHRLGLQGQHDRLPKALLQPVADVAQDGYVPDMHRLMSDYYLARGWDESTGRPTRATLARLELPHAADDLWGPAA